MDAEFAKEASASGVVPEKTVVPEGRAAEEVRGAEAAT